MMNLIIICRYCQKETEQVHPNQRVCSDCKKRRNREAQKEKHRKWYSPKKTNKKCTVCGCDYFGTVSVTCSDRCRMIHNRTVQRMEKEFHRFKINLFKSWVMWGQR